MSSADVRAIVFDFDGLILDTETPIWQSWTAVFAEHGCAFTLDEWAREVGSQHALDPMALLVERSGRADLDGPAITDRRRAHRDELLALEQVRPGVTDWLAEAASRGLGLAIASSSEIEWVEPHLTRLGLRHHFQHLSCWNDELPAKPEPDLYLAACAAVGVDPAAAIAVEDSPNGVTAAKAAGLRVVAVPNTVTAKMDLSAADLTLTSLADVSLADALARLSTTT